MKRVEQMTAQEKHTGEGGGGAVRCTSLISILRLRSLLEIGLACSSGRWIKGEATVEGKEESRSNNTVQKKHTREALCNTSLIPILMLRSFPLALSLACSGDW